MKTLTLILENIQDVNSELDVLSDFEDIISSVENTEFETYTFEIYSELNFEEEA